MEKRIDYLLRQYYYNKASQAELEEFLAVVRSARHEDSIARVITGIYAELKRQDPSRTLVDTEGNLKDIDDLLVHDLLVQNGPADPGVQPLIPVRRWRWAAVAAVWLSLGVGSGYFLWQRSGSTGSESVISSAISPDEITATLTEREAGNAAGNLIVESTSEAPQKITLNDGTKVWLNASSRLEFPDRFDSTQRRVVYLTGEAYFEVEKAEKWPFVVRTDEVRTTVVGTKFNVKAYPDMADVEVAVRTGRVVVSRKDDVLATLGENQELKVPLFEHSLVLRERSLTEKIAGNWTAGYLEYEDEAIEDILADLERVYQVRINLQRSELAPQRMTLSAKKEKGMKHMLDVICSLTNSAFEEQEEGVYTLR